MPKPTEHYFENCLYFTANALAREIAHMAEEEFGKLGMSPSHAFLLMLVVDRPGISQKELAGELHLAPSTVSRFVDALVRRGFVEKRAEGRQTFVAPTPTGKAQIGAVEAAWKALYDRYNLALGKETADQLTGSTRRAFLQLNRR